MQEASRSCTTIYATNQIHFVYTHIYIYTHEKWKEMYRTCVEENWDETRNRKKHKGHVQLIGYHGQTIFHNGDEKITRQLGDGALLSQLTKKKLFTILDKTI